MLSKVDVTLDISVKNSLDCIILDSWVFENVILADELFVIVLQILETCVSVNNILCINLFSSLEFPIKFDERFKVTSVPFFLSLFSYFLLIFINFFVWIHHFKWKFKNVV